jgi:hypothetical protein
VAASTEETSKIKRVYATIVVFVDGAIGCEEVVVVSDFQVAFEDVKTSLEGDLRFENCDNSMLNVVSEAIVAANSHGWTVQRDVSEQVVFARKQHLQEAKFVR